MCDVGDTCDVWRERLRRAAKVYRCNECRAPIPRGNRYVNIGTLFDGHWETLRVHWECLVLWGSVQMDLCGGHGSIVIGGLGEELMDYDGGGEWSDGNGGDDGGEWVSAATPYRERFEAIRQMYASSGPVRKESR